MRLDVINVGRCCCSPLLHARTMVGALTAFPITAQRVQPEPVPSIVLPLATVPTLGRGATLRIDARLALSLRLLTVLGAVQLTASEARGGCCVWHQQKA